MGRWLALLLAAALVLGSVGAQSADDPEEPLDLEKMERDRKKRSSLYPVRPRTSRYLEKAALLVDEGETAEAQKLLARLGPSRLNPTEQALVLRMQAFVAYSASDYPGAIEAFEKVLKLEVLPLRDENRIRFNIAQLQAASQNWSGVISAIHRWLRYTAQPDPLGYYLLAIAHYQLEQFDDALKNVEIAVDLSPKPPESWLQLLAALYIQKQDYAAATPVLEELVLMNPKKQYWVQLSLIYGALENYTHSLAVQQLAYTQGLLTEDQELRRLARSFLFHDLPYPAAQLLTKGLEDEVIEPDPDVYELLANSWVAAREYDRSVPALKTAARLAKDGNLYVRLGQVQLQREDWQGAVESLGMALDRGGLDNPGNARLLLGISLYNSGRVDEARSAFVQAREHETSREAASNWLTHMEREASQAG